MRSIKSRGFTIVELLIVIVIIGVLAALVIVAYNGIQQRANNTQTIDAVSKYVRVVMMYAQDKGDYPRTSTVSANTNACLGKNYSYSSNTCAHTVATVVCGTGQATVTSAFNTKLEEYINTFPDPSPQIVTWCGGPFTGILVWSQYVHSVYPLLPGR